MRLKYQLFITLLIASALLVAVILVINSLSFSRGFLSYINSAEAAKLKPLATALEAQYAKDGNWDSLTDNPQAWHALLFENGVDSRFIRRPPKGRQTNKRPPPPPTGRIGQRLVLANHEKETLFGRLKRQDEPNWQELKHQDKVVGYLGLVGLKRLDQQFDQAFERQQMKSFALAGLCMVFLSALLAAPLASRIVKPILSVKSTVAEISQGNLEHRIETKRRDEIGDLATDINKLGETLEQNREARHRLIAEISHELRTPVAVLQGELEALQDGVRELNSESINSLHTETIRLNRLIDDLHTLSLANTGALEYQMQPVNLAELVQTQISGYQTSESDLNISLQTSVPAPIFNADKQRIQQLIDNLMQNSIRYTDKPGSVSISVENDTTKNSVKLHWSDSSPGVEDTALEKLFDPLFRAEKSRSREFGGAGLGLSIVKKIVDAHHGTCTATHSESGGLTISISFPSIQGTHS